MTIFSEKFINATHYDDCYKWLTNESTHFIFKFVNRTLIVQNLKKIVNIFEKSYNDISIILQVDPKIKFKIYIVPNNKFCEGHNIIPNSALPQSNLIVIIYNNLIELFTKSIRHELTHLLAFHWDSKIYHIELLEEGLACYLSDIKTDYHKCFLNKLIESVKKDLFCDLSLYISKYYRMTDYDKAASFAKFIIENYGINKFKELFLESVVDRNDNVYIIKNKELPKTYLYSLLDKVFAENPIEIQMKWLCQVVF